MSMTQIGNQLLQLEAQLREDGYKGTQWAMRLVKTLRNSLEGLGYSFEPSKTTVTTHTKGDGSIVDALNSLS